MTEEGRKERLDRTVMNKKREGKENRKKEGGRKWKRSMTEEGRKERVDRIESRMRRVEQRKTGRGREERNKA